MSSEPAESRLVGRVDGCDVQSAKPRAGTPARDPRPATRSTTRVETSAICPYPLRVHCSPYSRSRQAAESSRRIADGGRLGLAE
eukprot:5458203-Prymnesium_polylepis.1